MTSAPPLGGTDPRVTPGPLAGPARRLRTAGCVFAEEEAALLLDAAGTPELLDALIRRRVSGEPLEQVLGWVAFRGLRLALEPGVFVPRRRTEFLATEAAALIVAARAGVPGRQAAPAVVLDLCCGCGAVGAALAADPGGVEVHAVDVDPVAVRVARRNLPAHVGTVYLGDLDAPLPRRLRGRVSVVAANTPYVPTAEIALLPPEARLHEPRAALDGGPDGLDVLRRVAAAAPGWLAPGGHLLIETGRAQVPAALAAFARAGLQPRAATCDDLDATVVIGRMGAG